MDVSAQGTVQNYRLDGFFFRKSALQLCKETKLSCAVWEVSSDRAAGVQLHLLLVG